MLRSRGARLVRSSPFFSGPNEAGDNFYYSSLCANLRVKCEPDGDIEHQRQVTVCVCPPLPILAQAMLGGLRTHFWPFSMAGLRA